MNVRRIVPEVVRRVLEVGGEDVYSISLVITGAEPYFLVEVSGDNAATLIVRRLWSDLPGEEGVYYLTVERRITALDESIPVVVTTRPMSVLGPDLENDDASYRLVYRTEDTSMPDHARLAADLQRVAQALAAGGDVIGAVAEALAASHPAVTRWLAGPILSEALAGRTRVWVRDLEDIAHNVEGE